MPRRKKQENSPGESEAVDSEREFAYVLSDMDHYVLPTILIQNTVIAAVPIDKRYIHGQYLLQCPVLSGNGRLECEPELLCGHLNHLPLIKAPSAA